MKRKKKSRIVSFLATIVFLLLIVATVGAIINYTDVVDKINDYLDPAFSIEVDDKEFKSDTDNYLILPLSGRAKFTIKGSNSYKVKVLSNVSSSDEVTYIVNGITHNLSEENYTSVLIDSDDVFADCFYIDCDNNYNLINVLSGFWHGAEIELEKTVLYPYLLRITSSSGENIDIQLGTYLSLSLPENIVF